MNPFVILPDFNLSPRMYLKQQTLFCSCVHLKHGTAINNACHSFSRNISSWTTGQFVFPGMRVCIVWGRPLDLHFKYTKSFETLLLLSHCCHYFVPPPGPSVLHEMLQNIWFVFRSLQCSSLELCGVWLASQKVLWDREMCQVNHTHGDEFVNQKEIA